MFNYQVFLDYDWGWLWCHWVECDWTKFGWPYVKSLSCSNVSLDELGQVRRVGWLSEYLIRLTQVYDWFGTSTQASWYNWERLAQVALCAVGLTQIGWVVWAVGLTQVDWVQLESPKLFVGSSDLSLPSKPRHHSHHRYHTPVPGDYQIRSCSSGAVISNFGIRGREQLNLQINSLACIETSKLLHVSGILSSTGRLPLLQILSFNKHLLRWKHHP